MPTIRTSSAPSTRSRRAGGIALALACALAASSLTGCVAPEPVTIGHGDLDEVRREAVAAYREGGERWAAIVERTRTDPRLAIFLVDNAAAALVRHFVSGQMSRRGAVESPYERARRSLSELGAPAAELLEEMVIGGDEVVAGAGVDALAVMDGHVLDAIVRILADGRVEVRRRGAALAALAVPLDEAAERRLVDVLAPIVNGDPSWVVRAEAVRAAGARAARSADMRALHTGLLATGLEDADATVVGIAADGLGTCRAVNAVPALIGALGRVEDEVVAHDRVQRALKLLVRESEPHTPAQWWQLWLERRAELLRAT
ncbi:hypothetical protein Pla163_14130 [Planctomycetes bacterium Pla163]|uniref:HEAT repeat protein n=1 Tax=Rohdeia mirabilis TaxID=2528008 RepID=A0A518CYL4_9BACT|nr:hypothetical protein Pla163_14130 [Planctomycetes bacterium Pla163]